MLDVLADYYPWIKALHILSVIAWMAGLLYLPRLMAYHHRWEVGTETYATFCTMERRLLKIIMLPSMIASFLFGVLLLLLIDPWAFGWFHVKILAVVFLAGYHGFLSRWARDFEGGVKPHNERFFRMINEAPFVLAIVIVIMAVVKPF